MKIKLKQRGTPYELVDKINNSQQNKTQLTQCLQCNSCHGLLVIQKVMSCHGIASPPCNPMHSLHSLTNERSSEKLKT